MLTVEWGTSKMVIHFREKLKIVLISFLAFFNNKKIWKIVLLTNIKKNMLFHPEVPLF